MEKIMVAIIERALEEAAAADFWQSKANENYGKDFPRTNPNDLYTKLWRQAYTRRDLLFEILAEAEGRPLADIIHEYDPRNRTE